MKIVKQFDSNEWAIKHSGSRVSSWDGAEHKPNWTWALGDDGYLYGQGWILGHLYTNGWCRYEDMSFGIPLTEMKKIVKEFGHLLVWL